MSSGNGDRSATVNGRRRRLRVGIVGAGFGGLGMAIRLRQEGLADFTIYERGATVGGVWRANTYPGAACDVPSHLYSFSFAPGHNWTRRYAPQAEILDYLEEITDRFGLRPHIRFDTEVTEARFDEESGSWELTAEDGTTERFDALVAACGQLTRPAIPPLPGIEDFEGPSFHSSEWDHGLDLDGRRVAVVGTGASAIQFVPEIAPRVAQLDIYQRSAPWIIPKSDRTYPEWERRLFRRFPARVAASRAGLFAFFEGATYGFTGKDWVMRPFAGIANLYRRRELKDRADLLAATTPDYAAGCKRVLFTSDWYSTLKRPNVELITGAVERVVPSGLIAADGVERPADAIIYGTGFQSHNFVAPMATYGIGAAELGETWGKVPEAYLGTVVSGYPNMFILYGPNTNHGSGSVPYTHECQFSLVLDAVRHLRDGGYRWVDLRPEVQARWRMEMDERSRSTAWVKGCANWYVNEDGTNTNNWPGPWLEFRRRTEKLEPSEYSFMP